MQIFMDTLRKTMHVYLNAYYKGGLEVADQCFSLIYCPAVPALALPPVIKFHLALTFSRKTIIFYNGKDEENRN